MSRIAIPADMTPHGGDSDSDDSGDEAGGFRVGADPEAKSNSFAIPQKSQKKKGNDSFFPSTKFQGNHPGYIYKKGDLGLGYYKDSSAQKKQPSAADMMKLLRSKEKQEAAAPRFSGIPSDTAGDDDDDDDDDAATQAKASLFSRFLGGKSKKKAAAPPPQFTPPSSAGSSNHPNTPRPGKTAPQPVPTFQKPTPSAAPAPVPSFQKPASSAPHVPHMGASGVPKSGPPAMHRRATPRSVSKHGSSPTAVTEASTTTNTTATNSAAPSGIRALTPEHKLEKVLEGIGFGLPNGVMGLSEGLSSLVRHDKLLYLSSHGPQLPSDGYVRGRVGPGAMPVDQAQMAATLTALSVFKTLKSELGSLDSIKRVLKINVQVVCSDHSVSTDLMDMVEPFFQILCQVLGGEPTLSVCGVMCLAHNLPLQADVVLEVV